MWVLYSSRATQTTKNEKKIIWNFLTCNFFSCDPVCDAAIQPQYNRKHFTTHTRQLFAICFGDDGAQDFRIFAAGAASQWIGDTLVLDGGEINRHLFWFWDGQRVKLSQLQLKCGGVQSFHSRKKRKCFFYRIDWCDTNNGNPDSNAVSLGRRVEKTKKYGNSWIFFHIDEFRIGRIPLTQFVLSGKIRRHSTPFRDGIESEQ